MDKKIFVTDKEVFMPENRFIVSKTDLKGKITYCNDLFVEMSGYTEKELLGNPHSILRHPDMPRCVFKLLWDVISSGKEIFAYVKNRCKNGDFYWVQAHVTPTFDENKKIISYHSNRRKPKKESVESIESIYKTLLETEESESNRKVGMQKAYDQLVEILNKENITYEEFIFSLD